MNSFKLNNFQKFACFALIIIMVVCAVGFASDGWQIDLNQINKPTTNNNENLPTNKEESADTNKENDSNQSNNAEETPPPPQYFSIVTGLQISEAEASPIALSDLKCLRSIAAFFSPIPSIEVSEVDMLLLVCLLL